MWRRTPVLIAIWLILCGALSACGGGGEASADASADAVATGDTSVSDGGIALPADAGRGQRPVGADCTSDLECEVGACVDLMCSTPCESDGDCGDPGLICARRGGGYCSPVCETIADCRPGRRCVTQGPGRGSCAVPHGAPGGAACSAPADCDSWFCAGDRCLAACDRIDRPIGLPAETDPCAEGTVCLPLHTQAVCVPAGDRADEAPCLRGSDCATGVCRGGRCTVWCHPTEDCPNDRLCTVFDDLALCERRCHNSADCGPTGLCQVSGGGRRCVVRGTAAPGQPCARHADCTSGRCDEGSCASGCAGGCDAADVCVADISGATCRPRGPSPLGGECRAHDECDTGFCAAGRCAVDCADGRSCPADLRCTEFSNGRFCFPPCRTVDDCSEFAFCDPSFAEGATCFWRGPTADGGPCSRHRDCRSGRCEGGRCLPECANGRCPAGLLCSAYAQGAYCAGPVRRAGAPCDDSPTACADDLACVAGVCTTSCDGGCGADTVCVEGWCHPRCAAHDDCRPGHVCNSFDVDVPFCEAPGRGAAGEACRRSAECASGLCFNGACRASCEAWCDDGARCVALGFDRFCLPAGETAIGAICDIDSDCRSGLCIGRRCASPCEEGTRCPAAGQCTALRAGWFCVWSCPALEEDDVCVDDEICQPDGTSGDGRCARPDDGAPLGAPCVSLAACAPPAVVCYDAGDGARCRGPCDPNRDPSRVGQCADGEICVRFAADARLGACMPAGEAPPMAPCAASNECAGGLCVRFPEAARCGPLCLDDGDCPADAICVDRARDPNAPFRICAPECDDGICGDGLACRQRLDGHRACY